jgi:hypothetical protein
MTMKIIHRYFEDPQGVVMVGLGQNYLGPPTCLISLKNFTI